MRTVLVADADHAARVAVSSVLHDKGFSVVMASDAARARTVLEDNPTIAALVADAALSTAHDAQLVTELRADARYENLPIIVVGSSATIGEIMRCLEQGASRFVAKAAVDRGLAEEIDAVFVI